MKKLSKTIRIVLLTIFVSVSIVSVAFARNNVRSIFIDVVIHDNGSATISQQWVGTFDEGTELYLPIEDKSLIVKNLKVWRNNREYLLAERWDVDASFESKKWRCGINKTSKGVELCFGITEYGENAYTFTYDIDPLVKAYDDADGFNFQFVNPNMSIFPSNVNLRIRLDDGKALTTDNARIWGFGFNGSVYFSDNYAIAFTDEMMRGSNYMNIMLKIYKGLISPNVKATGNFDDLQQKAFEGSSYSDTGERLYYILFYLITGGILLMFILRVISQIIRKKRLKDFYKNGDYFRDRPNNGDIEMSYVLFKDFDLWNSKDTNIIGAIIMKMINDGNLKPVQDKSYGLFGNEKIETSLKIGKEPKADIVKELYNIIINAAGSDNILQENELKKYATTHDSELTQYLDSLDTKGYDTLNKKNCYKKIFGKKLEDLTDNGQKELEEVYGLRKFLDEFTLIDERGITEGVIWEDLLVYATLFGQAKKVLKELKRVYPDQIDKINKISNTYYISNSYFRTLYYSSEAVKRARLARMAANGLGGVASIGGGGGFSGGGSGGGTR